MLFTDAAHANLSDGLGSMGAYIIFLVAPGLLSYPLEWSSGKIKRVVRSTIAAEALSLQTGIEAALYMRQIIKNMTVVNVPIIGYTDNKSVIQAIHSTKMVDDKRLRIDISAIKESLSEGEVEGIRWCPGASQLANCMTKRGASGFHLLPILQTGRMDLDI